LVTGAAGFLGRYVVDALLRRDHEVSVLVRPAADLSEQPWRNRVDVFRADLRQERELATGLAGVDAVIHLAARLGGSDEEQFAAAAVGTERLLAAMAQANIRRLILASSYSVYDWAHPCDPLCERSGVDDPYRRGDGYATAKIWQERIARRASRRGEIDLTILRPGFIWGRERPWAGGAGEIVGNVAVVVAPRARPPLTYVENCADCFATVLECASSVRRTFNVIDESGASAWEFAGEYLAERTLPRLRIPVPYGLAWVLVRMIGAVSRILFGERGRLPSLIDPPRFQSRFRPLTHTAASVREACGWTPPYSVHQAIGRTTDRI